MYYFKYIFLAMSFSVSSCWRKLRLFMTLTSKRKCPHTTTPWYLQKYWELYFWFEEIYFHLFPYEKHQISRGNKQTEKLKMKIEIVIYIVKPHIVCMFPHIYHFWHSQAYLDILSGKVAAVTNDTIDCKISISTQCVFAMVCLFWLWLLCG